ncbi:MAG: formamidopyrimidine-DNA glycosylase [Myxococcaceae bacterium]|nr:formamidopyrimidine-DNA glycosylase [Myxococcaceae bacterium]
MPEIPDLTVYLDALKARVHGRLLEGVRLGSPFVLRSVEPPLNAFRNRRVESLSRLGKRLVIGVEGDLFLVVHLMIAGRLQWKPKGQKLAGRVGLAAFDFENGTLVLTEVSTKKRASLHTAQGRAALAAFDRGGLEVLTASLDAFANALRRENHTIKRTLTDPTIFAGIGNAYSDEILHAARMSPVKQTKTFTGEDIATLFQATRTTLTTWVDRLRAETRDGWPEKVTAFRDEMAVHGKHGQACPVCGAKVQRIVHAENETNYCPGCQTGGKLLADRSLSRLLKDDWPTTLDALEDYVASRQPPR